MERGDEFKMTPRNNYIARGKAPRIEGSTTEIYVLRWYNDRDVTRLPGGRYGAEASGM